MYESRQERPIGWKPFIKRLFIHFIAMFLLLLISLGIGIAGYMGFEKHSLTDAILNACMLLGDMGPVNTPVTTAGKLFASFYALYSGLIFILAIALIFTPVLHRILHLFHSDDAL